MKVSMLSHLRPSTMTTATTATTLSSSRKKEDSSTVPVPIPAPAVLAGGERSNSLEAHFGIDLTFDQLYKLVQQLRSGSFGSVWVGRHFITDDEFAVKVIDRRKLKPRDDKAVFREVSILQELTPHPNIVSLVDFFESPHTFHVILELARGGDVFDRLSQRTVYTERDARGLARHLLTAVQYMHYNGILHRDLKPENLLLIDVDDDVNGLKVADFGFAKKLSDATNPAGLTTRCGTPAFVAPEICIGDPYGKGVDVWSCGVILYLLLGGYPPFQADNHKGLFRKIRAADYVFHEKYWDPISVPAKKLIASMLTVDPFARITIDQALASKWMTMSDVDDGTNDSISDFNLTSNLEQMSHFNARRKLKSAMHAVSYLTSANFWNSDAVTFMSRNTTASHDLLTSMRKLEHGKVGRTFTSIYALKDKIRTGSHATVYSGKERVSGKRVAIKIVPREKSVRTLDAQVMNEVAILKSLRHKHVVSLRDFFEEMDQFCLVMELMDGGDVFDRIVERTHYTEKCARDLAKALLLAVEYIHSRGVAHRDLKPQNLLLLTKDNDSYIKVADFGFAKRVHTPQSLMTRCGTPTYVAPEILKNHPHDESADMWSVGVIIYVLLVGYPPFMDENQRQLFRKIRMGDYHFYKEDWTDISDAAKQLIRGLLVVDPMHRLSASACLRDEWVCEVDDNDLSSTDLSSALDEIKTSLETTSSINAPSDAPWVTCACLPR